MSDNITVKRVFSWEPSSRMRSQGSSGWTVWKKIYIEQESPRYDITTGRQRVSLQERAGDRKQWRELVAASTAGTSFVMTT